MKEVWVKAVPWDKNLVTTALESGADAVMVPEKYTAKVKELGIIRTIAKDGDLKLGQDIVEYKIKSGKDEKEIVKLTKTKKVIVKTTDWTIIPLRDNSPGYGKDPGRQVPRYGGQGLRRHLYVNAYGRRYAHWELQCGHVLSTFRKHRKPICRSPSLSCKRRPCIGDYARFQPHLHAVVAGSLFRKKRDLLCDYHVRDMDLTKASSMAFIRS
jgi:hypothetical protein